MEAIEVDVVDIVGAEVEGVLEKRVLWALALKSWKNWNNEVSSEKMLNEK